MSETTNRPTLGRRLAGGALTLALATVTVAGLSQPSHAAGGETVLRSGESLADHQSIRSPNGRYQMDIYDGSVAVIKSSTDVTYRSGINNDTASKLVVQPDGNLVLYSYDGKPIWHTGTYGRGPAELRMQDDGNLVLYSTRTWQPLWWSGVRPNVSGTNYGTVWAGENLYSPDGEFMLSMQTDGNLVLRNRTSVLWNSRTYGNANSRLVVNGQNAHIATPDNRAVWWTPSGSGSYFTVQNDGNVVLYAPGAIWYTNTAKLNCDGVSGPVTIDQTVVAANNIRVHACLAPTVNRMVADAKAQGITLKGGGWRDQQVQINLRIANCGGDTYYNIWQKPSSQCNPPTAIPGRSMHERGLAIDFSNSKGSITSTSPEFAWLTANAASYGLYILPSESWHWSTNGY